VSKVFVKQYGCQRSGTCYVSALIGQNFPDVHLLVHTLGRKHAAPVNFTRWRKQTPDGLLDAIKNNELRIAIATKNPYAWARSYIRAQRQWRAAWRQAFFADPQKALAERCEVWNQRHRLWLAVPFKHLMVFRHEDLLTDFEATLARAADKLALTPYSRPFVNIPHRLTPNGDVSDALFDTDYYCSQRYLAELDDRLIATVTDSIDWDLAARMDYHPRHQGRFRPFRCASTKKLNTAPAVAGTSAQKFITAWRVAKDILEMVLALLAIAVLLGLLWP